MRDKDSMQDKDDHHAGTAEAGQTSQTGQTGQTYPVTELCDAFEVSRSGFYQWRDHRPGPRQLENDAILKEMRAIHSHRHTSCYGSPRMTVELRKNQRWKNISENRVARLMQENEIRARFGAPFRPKTTQVDKSQTFSPNLVGDSCPGQPGEVVVSDITYIPTKEGWLYLAVVIDLCSRAVLGWSVASTLETGKLLMPALHRALASTIVRIGAIFHSDRGCQYTSSLLRNRLSNSGLRQSMSAAGYCYDNAFCESFFGSLKAEAFPENGVFETMADARLAVFDYITTFYNSRRLHSSLDYRCPNQILNSHFPNLNHHLN